MHELLADLGSSSSITLSTVLIYSCPPSSPIKSRLIYSSAVLVLYKVALPQFTGQKISKKVSRAFRVLTPLGSAGTLLRARSLEQLR